jgi:hypothetical protein
MNNTIRFCPSGHFFKPKCMSSFFICIMYFDVIHHLKIDIVGLIDSVRINLEVYSQLGKGKNRLSKFRIKKLALRT